jgi:putative resolvase
MIIQTASNKISIRQAANILGVSQATLRRWEKSGKLVPEKTVNGHRRYDKTFLENLGSSCSQDNGVSICYARVSTHGQKSDLERQVNLLQLFCSSKGWKYEVIEDLGSGINFNKKGLKSLIDKIIERKFERLVLTKRDRLLRFGSELIFQLCESNNIEVVIIDQTETNSFEEELVADVLEIITVFSAKLYGKRSHKTKKLINVISKELKAKD